jgi:ribosomal protein S18 acetylase RimI-like enzyme
VAPLKSLEAKQVHLRVMEPSDIPQCMRLKEIAGWNQTSEDWLQFMKASPEGCFVAETAHGHVVGSATTIVYDNRFAWIGMVLVDPEFRGQGIGTMLLVNARDHLAAKQVPCAKLDATPQGKPLYQKLGFHTEYEIERYTLVRPRAAATVPPQPQSVDEALNFDRHVFGADRSSILLYFAEQSPEFVVVEKCNGGLSGYCLGRKGSTADQLGPWVAQDRISAQRLLDCFLNRSSRELVFVDLVKANRWAGPLLAERGFRFSRALTRMYCGRNLNPGQPDLLCAIAGPEFG